MHRIVQPRDEKGQAMTEFAVVLPVVALVLFAIVQFGIAFNNYLTLTDAVRRGARTAAVSRQTGTGSADTVTAVKNAASDLDAVEARRDCLLLLGARDRRDRLGHVPVLDQPLRTGRRQRKPEELDDGEGRMKLRDDNGQTIVFTTLALIGVLGMTALVLDVGSWFRAQRAAQSAADAAALAGAQFLPNGGNAVGGALAQAGKNGGGVLGADITIASTSSPTDTIGVTASRPATAFFAKLLSFADFTVHAHATATAELPAEAQYVAPMVVSKDHPLLGGVGLPVLQPGHLARLRRDGRARRVRDAEPRRRERHGRHLRRGRLDPARQHEDAAARRLQL